MAPAVLYRVLYGTTDPELWQKKLTTVRPALLPSHRRHHVKFASYPAIVPCDGSSVRGSVVTGLTQGDVYRLDIFEGSQYERKKVKVKVLKNVGLDAVLQNGDLEDHTSEEVDAETYIWKDDLDGLEDGEWDFEEFKREHMRFWVGEVQSDESGVEVDEGFADVDNAVAAQNGIDHTGGRGLNGAISKQLDGA